jgi:hypothetical protein
MLAEAQVGPQRNNDDQVVKLRLGSYGELMCNDMNGFFAEQVLRGNGYVWSTPIAGVALIAMTTANAPALWNPPSSGKVCILQKITYLRTAVGTPLEGGIVYFTGVQPVRGVGTAADLPTNTPVAGRNLRLDIYGDQSGMTWCPATITSTAAFSPTFHSFSGVSQIAATGTTTGIGNQLLVDRLDGLIVIPPGGIFAIGANVSLSTTYAISVFGICLPVPNMA